MWMGEMWMGKIVMRMEIPPNSPASAPHPTRGGAAEVVGGCCLGSNSATPKNMSGILKMCFGLARITLSGGMFLFSKDNF